MSQAIEIMPQIAGSQIISTIENMAGLGSIGRQVLSDIGIHELDPEKKYPFQIRLKIHEAVLKRYGPEALYALGLSYGAGWKIHYDQINSVLKKRLFVSQDSISHFSYLDIFLKKFASFSTDVLCKSNFEDIEYSMISEIIEEKKFKFVMTTTSSIVSEPFTRGYIVYFLHHSLSQFWNIEVKYLEKETKSGNYWTRFTWIGNFSSTEHKNSSQEIARELLSINKEKLLGSVLDEVDKKNKLLMESIQYASLLQKGQLPKKEHIINRFSSFATIWEPRDTIGGDLYWLSSYQQSGPFALAVADCTGHGVPGAMLSLLVSNSLERIYANGKSEEPAEALMSLDHYIRTGLNQDRPDSESDDGCDAAVLRIDRDKQTIEFAGAKLGLFQVNTQGEVTRHQGSRCSLGYQDAIEDKDKPVVQTIRYQACDAFVIVTDGLTDQIGGPTGKTSYGYRRLENILKANCSQNAQTIADAVRSDYAAWQGTESRRDDVTAVFFRL